MKLNVPELEQAADEMRRLREGGTAVFICVDRRTVYALELIGFGLCLLAGAIAGFAIVREGSGVATKKGGRRGN